MVNGKQFTAPVSLLAMLQEALPRSGYKNFTKPFLHER
jgi:hypothetical protein